MSAFRFATIRSHSCAGAAPPSYGLLPEAMDAKDGRWLEAAGIVLSGSGPAARRVMFITLEAESGIANLVVWLKFSSRTAGPSCRPA